MDYQNGKIYKLVGGGLTYYGSTCADLRCILYKHKDDFKRGKNIKSKLLFETGDNVEIYLVEKYPCNDKMELNMIETHWIENNECVNKNIPTRRYTEWYEAKKEKNSKQKKRKK